MNKVIQSQHFKAERAWGALDITNMNGISVRLHWTDKPYKWHINDGEEVFAVMDGTVECATKKTAKRKPYCSIQVIFFYAGIGTEHVAHPQGEARILVIEKEDSI